MMHSYQVYRTSQEMTVKLLPTNYRLNIAYTLLHTDIALVVIITTTHQNTIKEIQPIHNVYVHKLHYPP